MECYDIRGRVIKCSKSTVTVYYPCPLHHFFFSERQRVGNLGVVSQLLFLPFSQTASHNNTISYVSPKMVTPSHSTSLHQARMGRSLTMLLTMWLESPLETTKLRPQNNTRSCLFSASSTTDSPACPSSNYISSSWVLLQSFLYFLLCACFF